MSPFPQYTTLLIHPFHSLIHLSLHPLSSSCQQNQLLHRVQSCIRFPATCKGHPTRTVGLHRILHPRQPTLIEVRFDNGLNHPSKQLQPGLPTVLLSMQIDQILDFLQTVHTINHHHHPPTLQQRDCNAFLPQSEHPSVLPLLLEHPLVLPPQHQSRLSDPMLLWRYHHFRPTRQLWV